MFCFISVQTTLNNVEVSIEYTQSLKKSLQEECSALSNQTSKMSVDKLESCLTDLTQLNHRFKDILEVSLLILPN